MDRLGLSILLTFLLGAFGCAEDLTGVEPLPPEYSYRETWEGHPDNPFTRSIGGHPDGRRYIYYNDLTLFADVREGVAAAEGAVVVKEVFEDDALVYLAVMRRLADHPDVGSDGWVYSISRDRGETEHLGRTCTNCHADPLSLGSLWAPPPVGG